MAKIRVVIADDHAVLRTGLRLLLESQPDIEVVGEAGDVAGAVAVTRRVQPDVLLLDLTLPDSKGGDTVLTVMRECPQTRVLVLTMHDDPGYLRASLAAGAQGYVVKRAADTELAAGVRAVASGRTFIDVAIEGEIHRVEPPPAAQRRPSALSARERQVLALLARGNTNREIARSIGVGVKTAETYRLRLCVKLGLRTRADLVSYALEMGLLTPGRET